MLLGFSYKYFSVVARGLEVGSMIDPWLGKHVKPLELRLVSLRSCLIAVPSDYESKVTECAPVPVHTL